MRYRMLFPLLSLIALSACTQRMGGHSRLKPLERDKFLPDGSTALQPVQGTVPRENFSLDTAVTEGKVNGKVVKEIPIPITKQLIDRGHERYDIYCAPCHGLTGNGDGMIVRRGFLAPPSYYSKDLMQAPDGHFFDVITHGHGAMFSYADRVNVHDRWAITAYIRVLQASHTRFESLSPREKEKLEKQDTSSEVSTHE